MQFTTLFCYISKKKAKYSSYTAKIRLDVNLKGPFGDMVRKYNY